MILKETKPAKFEKAVILCCDKNALHLALFVADQIHRSEPDADFDICLTTFDSSLLDNESIPTYIRVCLLDDTSFANLMVDNRIPLTSYAKILIPDAFVNDYSQIVYLDTDTYLRKGRLSELFSETKGKGPVSGVIDSIQWQIYRDVDREKYWDVLDISGKKYVNAGVLVFDVDACVRSDFFKGTLEKSQKLIELTADNPEIQFFHDQSAINAHLAGDWHPVSLKWNWQTLAFATRLVDKFDPNILHFIAQTKPWVQPSVPFTRKYWPQYEAFFANSCGAPKGKASYSSFSPKRDFTVKERFKNELSFQKQLNRINVLNPLAYTKLNGIIPAYRKSLHIRKIENAIISGGQIWPLNDAVDKKL